jgi:2-polyprenyl-3-methyl-5-hydroxy-6-metoxy-1,4-benzoquinol methylase
MAENGGPSAEPPVSSNRQKFQTRNLVVRWLIAGFFTDLEAIIEPLSADSVLDAGCGEGEALERLRGSLPERIAAIDADPAAVAAVERRFPGVEVSQGSLYDLPFRDSSFDLVLCLEVLEHLKDPEAGLRELRRVTRRHIVISVPHEPWFRFGSAMGASTCVRWVTTQSISTTGTRAPSGASCAPSSSRCACGNRSHG